MEVVRSHRKSSYNDVVVSTLPLYRSLPPLEVRLEDFELFAMDRLRVSHPVFAQAMDLWKVNRSHLQATDDVNKNIISHFVIRLVYCITSPRNAVSASGLKEVGESGSHDAASGNCTSEDKTNGSSSSGFFGMMFSGGNGSFLTRTRSATNAVPQQMRSSRQLS
ncbi:probable DNA primase large subunit [Durio zibethinus]|uniref:Probable DNA primase large subunit n=1 Tax=Durio zibethinus TaxID=66656 RepID=A0A6P5Y5E4_DURZI|nr:probable DNA primase large subunit [Durio zibethinus]